MHWTKAWVIGWILLTLGVGFYECWSIWGAGKHTPPLTHVTVRYVPWYVPMSFLTWLWLHFAIRYANPDYIKYLKTH